MPARFKSHALRHKVADRDGWECRYCGRLTQCATCEPDAPVVATTDHIIPKSAGGTNALVNLCIACRPCNEAKDSADRPAADARAVIPDDWGKRDQPRQWQVKREAQTGIPTADLGCYPRKDKRRRPKKSYLTEEAAAAACVEVLHNHGRQLVPYACSRCVYWHLAPARAALVTKEQRAAANER